MTTPHRQACIRLACILIVLCALAAGCGGDEETKTSATTVFTPSTGLAATTAVATSAPATSTPTTSATATVVQGVTDGAVCSPQGARGVTQGGAAMVCTLSGSDLRWRPA